MNPFKNTAAALMIAITALAGCKSTPENIMTMTTAPKGWAELFMAGTGTATIDWGDGSASDTVTLSAPNENGEYTDSHRYTHTFSDTTSRTILIQVQNITHLYCDGLQLTALDVSKNTALRYLFCYKNRLTSLDVTNNTALIELICYDNQLTGLDVSKNTELTKLGCENNQLTAEGLNALFGTLHTNAGDKTIYIAGNPGTADCDRSIAEDKGWEVDTWFQDVPQVGTACHTPAVL